MMKLDKKCSCGIQCTNKNSKFIGETDVSETRILHWFNCACGSTLVAKGFRLDYKTINKIVTKEPVNVINYKGM